MTETPSLVRVMCRMSGWSCLEYAVHSDQLDTVKVILEHWSKEKGSGVGLAVHLARSEGVASLLLAAGADAAALNSLGQTPLVALARSPNPSTAVAK